MEVRLSPASRLRAFATNLHESCGPGTVGAAALTVFLRPFPALPDLLDMLFGHLESEATKPITPNRGFRNRMVVWQVCLSSRPPVGCCWL